jgi:hypothetical protein
VGSPVIDAAGVIGQVTRVHPLVSEVTLVIDRELSIPVLNPRTGVRSVAYGEPSQGALELRFMASNADIQEGDLLTTSGLDGVYPPGLPVARVTSIERRAESGFARVRLVPAAPANRVRHVLVLEPVSAQWPANLRGDPATQAPCKARYDRLRPDNIIVDLKTTRDASPHGFQRSIANFGYALQAAHYRRGMREVLQQDMAAWCFIAVEKEPPFLVACYVLDAESIDASDVKVGKALASYMECKRTGVWPGYSDLIEPISLPKWALSQD